MKFRLNPIAAAILAAYALPVAAQQGPASAADAPPPPSDGGTQLREVKVEADAPAPYKAETVQSPKFTQPLRDTPQTIQVITSDLFTQQGATTLTEALRNSPGVGTFYAGENGNTSTGDTIYMRGFDTSNSIFVDGVRDLGSISRDVFNLEQIEVEKGPAGTDNGRGAPTGAINLVSKQAFLYDAVSGTVSVGTDGQKRATADLNETLSGLSGSALRLNAMWQDSDVPGRDHVKDGRWGVAPSLGFGLDTSTRAYLNLLYMKQDNIPDGFVPTIGLPGWTPQPGLEPLVGHPVDPENFYGTRDDHDDVTAKMATLRIEHDFSDTLRLSNIARWGETTQDYLLSSFMGTSALDAGGNPTGNIRWTDPDDLSTYTIRRSNNNFKDQKNKILTDQINLRAEFATGSVDHTVSTGLELTREQQDAHSITATGSRPDANLYDPDWNDAGDLSWSRNGGLAEGQTDTTSAYLFDTARFGEHFLLTGGLRADRYKTEYRNTAVCNDGTGRGAVPCGGQPVGTIVETVNAEAKDTLFNWKLGAVYKPVEAGSLYVNYAISQQPPGGANFQLSTAAGNANNPNLDPQKAKTVEIGTKWEVLRDTLALNLALFRTEVTNEINTLVLDDGGNPTQTGEKRVQGIELSAVGSITENWSVSAGYTRQKTRVEEGAPVAQDGTSNLTYTPDSAFTAWTAYRFPIGLTVGGGARYSGGLHRGTDGAVGTPEYTESYTVYDAMAAYAVTDYLTLRMNAYNLFDKEYVAAINKSGYRYTPGTPRTFLFSGEVHF
jgi:catecholate siderophore receptor